MGILNLCHGSFSRFEFKSRIVFRFESSYSRIFFTNLVSDEHLDDVVVGGVGLELVEPVVDLLEGLAIGHVVDEDGALAAAVVARGEGAKPLLPGRVPDGQFDL